MEIFVSAGESSSDIHCAGILKALSEKIPFQSYGLGGNHLEKMGTELLMHNREFSVMGGPLEVIGKLPKRKKLEKLLEERLLMKKPDFALLSDNGEINLRLASLLNFFHVPVVYFIPPKVWVWRSSRMEKIKQHIKLVLSILPFEEPLYKEWEIPFAYVGNPLLDEIPWELERSEACKILNLDPAKKYVAVFPGSRHSELKFHIPLFSEALKIFMKKAGDAPEILIPIAPSMDEAEVKAQFYKHMGEQAKVHVFKTIDSRMFASHVVLKASRAALIKSGTSTLEAAALGIPTVLSYKSSAFTEWIYKYIVGYKGFIGMANLFLVQPAFAALGWSVEKASPVIPELILKNSKPELIAQALANIYSDTKERKEMLEKIAQTKSLLAPQGRSPIGRAADELMQFIQKEGISK